MLQPLREQNLVMTVCAKSFSKQSSLAFVRVCLTGCITRYLKLFQYVDQVLKRVAFQYNRQCQLLRSSSLHSTLLLYNDEKRCSYPTEKSVG